MGDCKEFDLPFAKLGEMMEKTGSDPVIALQCEALALAQAIRQCHACIFDTSCRDWLNRTAAGSAEMPPAFCPNSALLARLRSMRPPADIGSWL